MSIGLMLEVMDHAPADLTSGERLVLIVIAERANEGSRLAKQGENWTVDTIAARAGMKRTGLKAVFQGLAKKGCEVRVPIKFDGSGKPVFAFDGKSTTFQVPNLGKRGGHSIPTQRGDQGHPTDNPEGTPQHPRGEVTASSWGDQDHPHSLKSLKEPSNPSPLPPDEITEPSNVSNEGLEGGDGEFDSEAQRINAIVGAMSAQRSGNSAWDQPKVRAAVDKCIAAGRTLAEIERAFPICEADPATKYPGRVALQDFPWWDEDENCANCQGTGRILVRSQYEGDREVETWCPECAADPNEPIFQLPVAYCGTCDPVDRTITTEDAQGYRTARRCPTCHPAALQQQPAPTRERTPQINGGGYQAQQINGEHGRVAASFDRRRTAAAMTVRSPADRGLQQGMKLAEKFAAIDGDDPWKNWVSNGDA